LAEQTTERVASTPGPWQITQRASRQSDNFVVAPANAKSVAVVPFMAHDREEQEANARLIAAAPELLAALKSIRLLLWPLESIPGWTERVAAADVAIAKAEGRDA
jgi:hypothetical protein